MAERQDSMSLLMECPICLGSFTDPRMLVCLHTFCYQCVDDYMKHSGKDGQFTCPVCRKSLAIPPTGANAFPKNFFINSYMELVCDTGTGARSKTTTASVGGHGHSLQNRCSNSEDGDDCTQPEHFCIECGEYYCKACSKAHRKSKISRSHQQVAVGDLTEEMLRAAMSEAETPRCLKHDANLSLYCSTCQCAVCPTCCLISHKAHDFREISDVDAEAKAELRAAVTSMEHLTQDMKDQCEELDKAERKFDSNVSSAVATAHGVLQKVQQMVEKKTREVDQEIRNTRQEGGEKFGSKTKNLTLNNELAESVLQFVEDLLKNGSAYNRLASLPDVRSRLKRFEESSEQPLDINVPSSADLVLKHLDGLALKEEVNLSDGTEQTLEIVVKCGIKQHRIPVSTIPEHKRRGKPKADKPPVVPLKPALFSDVAKHQVRAVAGGLKVTMTTGSIDQQQVQWEYQDHDQSFCPYPSEQNMKIEKAHHEKKPSVQWREEGNTLMITFSSMKKSIVGQANSEVTVRRSALAEAQLPQNWQPMAADSRFKLVDLLPTDAEYKKVEANLRQSMATAQIIKIQRVQNPSLYKPYQAQKTRMDKANAGAQNERMLWHVHGTASTGLNRTYCGKNAVVYGMGVYFAVSADYSARSTYSPPDPQTGHKYMYHCRVLTGLFTTGHQGCREPPEKDPQKPGDRYDSVADSTTNPGIFVIFNDTQTYPEHLITFM